MWAANLGCSGRCASFGPFDRRRTPARHRPCLAPREPAQPGPCPAAVSSTASRLRPAASVTAQDPACLEQEVISIPVNLSADQRVQLIAGITQANSYQGLDSLIEQCGPELDPTVAAYAMMQAANLRDTAGNEALELADTYEQVTEILDSREALMEALVPCIEQHIRSYPESIQLTLVSAMAQLDLYSESIFTAVADACCKLGDATGGMAAVAEQAARDQAQASPTVIMEPTSSSESFRGTAASSSSDPSTSAAASDDRPGVSVGFGVLGLNLMLTSSAYAMAGHYDAELFDLIARQTVRYLDSLADLPTLVNILCAFMDLFHRDERLLEAAGMKLAEHAAELDPANAASVLLVYSFFSVRNAPFYESLLDIAGRQDLDSLDPKAASALYRAVKLLPEPVPIPASVNTLLSQAMERFGMLALSVTSPNIPSLVTLNQLEEAQDEQTLTVIQELGMDEIMARRQLFAVLSESMGLPTARNYSVTGDGWLPLHVAVQYEEHNMGFLILKDGRAYLRNDSGTVRGQVASEIRCIQQQDWIVLPMELSDWQQLLEDVADEEVQEGEELRVNVVRLAEELASRMAEAIDKLSEYELDAESGSSSDVGAAQALT